MKNILKDFLYMLLIFPQMSAEIFLQIRFEYNKGKEKNGTFVSRCFVRQSIECKGFPKITKMWGSEIMSNKDGYQKPGDFKREN